MIVFFSGTGNTRHCAEMLAERLGESLHEFSPQELRHPEECSLACGSDDVRIIWAFPTYSWGVPPVVANLMQNINLTDRVKQLPHYMLTTCGDDMAFADRQWRKILTRKGLECLHAFAVVMPNTYVLMKGFDVDSPTVARKKIESATARTRHIADLIAKMTETFNAGGYCEPVADVVRGRFAWIKTAVIYPWFKRYAMSPEPFFADSRCIGCSICANSCPLKNISMDGGHPRWGKDCALCLRCYHICPRHAVAYSIATRGKGQYTDLIGEVSASKGNAQAD